VSRQATVLDIGCGNGAFVYFLQQSGYQVACGVDVSAEKIAQGRKLWIQNLELFDVMSYLEKSVPVDCIVACDVLEHFTKQEAFDLLRLISKKLIPGRTPIMQVPNAEGLFYSSIFFGDYPHEASYTQSSARQPFLNCGFTAVQCFPTDPVAHGLVSSVRWLLWKIKVLNFRFWKMVETGNSKGISTSAIVILGVK